MRTLRFSSGLSLALAFAWGCGGNVVVDGAASGAGGAGGGTAMSSSATSSSASGSPGVSCDLLCGGPTGLCGCAGSCSDGKMRAVGCGEMSDGVACTCEVDNQVVGMCTESSLDCSLPTSCCEGVFGL